MRHNRVQVEFEASFSEVINYLRLWHGGTPPARVLGPDLNRPTRRAVDAKPNSTRLRDSASDPAPQVCAEPRRSNT